MCKDESLPYCDMYIINAIWDVRWSEQQLIAQGEFYSQDDLNKEGQQNWIVVYKNDSFSALICARILNCAIVMKYRAICNAAIGK